MLCDVVQLIFSCFARNVNKKLKLILIFTAHRSSRSNQRTEMRFFVAFASEFILIRIRTCSVLERSIEFLPDPIINDHLLAGPVFPAHVFERRCRRRGMRKTR